MLVNCISISSAFYVTLKLHVLNDVLSAKHTFTFSSVFRELLNAIQIAPNSQPMNKYRSGALFTGRYRSRALVIACEQALGGIVSMIIINIGEAKNK